MKHQRNRKARAIERRAHKRAAQTTARHKAARRGQKTPNAFERLASARRVQHVTDRAGRVITPPLGAWRGHQRRQLRKAG